MIDLANKNGKLGAVYLGDGRSHFLVWAPNATKVEVHILSPHESYIPLNLEKQDYFTGSFSGIFPGSLYLYRLNGKEEYPDPASSSQPDGVLGPSQIINQSFGWEDKYWYNIPLQKYIIYELHVGTYTSGGSFESIIHHLDKLIELGITAIELMPVVQFPGNRNWGYDGAYPFAVQNSYGGVGGLKHLINTCHKKGLSVILDVVYNHIGPEGNYLEKYGPYFTDKYKTMWGKAINYDGQGSDDVRRYFFENALYWITEFHIDALRLDAVHAILDFSPVTFIEELVKIVKEQADKLNRKVYLIAESDANDARLVRPRYRGGFGLDAQWNDDFHHALHVLLTGEMNGYYRDFGNLQQMAKAIKKGFVYSGEYSPSRGHRRGSSTDGIPLHRFINFSQNHDQVGNRIKGERLSHLVSFEALKLAASVVLFSPGIPLLFMGEEYGEPAYFPYFISHSDPSLVEAVRQGRKVEFASFQSSNTLPDPQSDEAFQSARLNQNLLNQGHHRVLFDFYRKVIQIRKELVTLNYEDPDSVDMFTYQKQNCLFYLRSNKQRRIMVGFNFGDSKISLTLPVPPGKWGKIIDSSEKYWNGSGSWLPDKLTSNGELTLILNPKSCILFCSNHTENDRQISDSGILNIV